MFIYLHTKDNPIYVNANHIIAYRQASKVEKELYDYNSVLVLDKIAELGVMEEIEQLNKLIKPVSAYHYREMAVADEKVPLDTPLKELYLSKRAENVLGQLGVQTLGDFNDALDPTKGKFIRGLGSVTYNEIIQKYHTCGYEFTWMNRTRQNAEDGE